jgi:7,8-dihydropterin-6-yl-methyl-4-(beta-D-ribofuranosyl)aminobenzene 5'-phosphate synthase
VAVSRCSVNRPSRNPSCCRWRPVAEVRHQGFPEGMNLRPFIYKGLTFLILAWVLTMTQSTQATDESLAAQSKLLRFHVVFNNVPYRAGLQTGWGFACLIEGLERTVLFDTGGDGGILLSNMQRLGLRPESVDAVVLSHIHADHTGGLDAFLASHPKVTVYLPASFPAPFQDEIKRHGATLETVYGPRQLMEGVYSTGEMGGAIKEQALIVETAKGLVVITGCAHPNVADMTEQAHAFLGKDIYLLMGGFHLGGSSKAEIEAIIRRLRAVGVQKVAPSHCTGEKAMAMFRTEWGSDFVAGGLGAEIEVPRT